MSRISMSHINTQRGRLSARRGRWVQAARQFAVATASSPTAENFYYLGNAQFKLEKFEEALASTQRAIDLDSSNPLWHVRLGALYERARKYSEAALAYATALEGDPENEGWKKRAERARKQAASQPAGHQNPPGIANTTSEKALAGLDATIRTAVNTNVPGTRVALLRAASDAEPGNSVLHFQLALSLIGVKQLRSALRHLENARTLDPVDPGLAFHQGWALRLDGRLAEAAKAFDTGIRLYRDPLLDKVGPGAYFQRQGLWEQAATLYEDKLIDSPNVGDIHYRAGLARERTYKWEAAAEHHYAALILDPESPGRHFRLGMARERRSDLLGAIDAYRSATRLDPRGRQDWQYRLAYCLHASGQTHQAIQIFCGMSQALTSPPWMFDSKIPGAPTPSQYEASLQRASLEQALKMHHIGALSRRGSALMNLGMFREAVAAFEAVVHQDAAQHSQHYFNLAAAQLACDDQDSAVESFLNVQKFRSPVDIGNHAYFEKQWQLNNMEYVEFSNAYPLEETHVLFESYHGTKIDCNPAEIYRQLRHEPAYMHLRFTWVVNKRCKVPRDVADDPRVSLVERGSVLYRRTLATAKYLVTNVSFPNYFVRRDGQKYLNTWHGTPLKTLGKDLGSGFMDHSNIGRNVLQTTHLLAPNAHTQDALITRNEAGDLFTGKVGRLGTPRIDRMMNVDDHLRHMLFTELGLPDDGRKVVLYAPTWRGTGQTKHFDRQNLERDLMALTNIDAHVLFRAHHLTERLLKGMVIDGVTIVPQDIDTYDILGIADVLVTDYSSIFFDYLGAGKPIVFYVYDLEEYIAERGLYFAMEDMPGELAFDTDGLTRHVGRALDGRAVDQERLRKSRLAFAPHEDGNATRRAIDFFFAESDDYVVDIPTSEKALLLFRHHFEPGTLTDALVAKINELSAAGNPVAVLFDKAELQVREDRQEQLALLPRSVLRLARVGSHITSLEERWNINQYLRSRNFLDDQQELIYRQAYEREFRRCIGTSTIGTVVQVSNLDAVGVSLLGSPSCQVDNRLLLSSTAGEVAQEAQSPPVSWYDTLKPTVAAIP